MSTTRTATRETAARTQPRRSHVTRGALGAVLVLASLGVLAASAYAGVAAATGNHVDLGAQGDYRTDRHGVASASTDWRTTFFGWAGSVRLQVAPVDDTPIFVGIAPPDTIDPYLSGASHTTFEEADGGGVIRTDHDGGAPSTPAATAVDWTASAEGEGTHTLRWDATDGPQVAFAMNADGSRGVEVRVVSSAISADRMPWWLPAAGLASGALGLAGGIVAIRRAVRPATRRPAPAS